jgi:hypothetical protein
VTRNGKVFRERVIFFKRLRLFIDYYECTRGAVVTRDVCATATANLLTVYRTYGTYSAWVISKHPVAPCSRSSYLRNHFVSTSAVRASIIEPDDRRTWRASVASTFCLSRPAGRRIRVSEKGLDNRWLAGFVIAQSRARGYSSRKAARKKKKKKKEKHRRGRWNYAERARNARLVPCNLMQQRRGQPQCIYRVILKFHRQNSSDEFLFALIYSFIENTVETSRSKLCESEAARDF